MKVNESKLTEPKERKRPGRWKPPGRRKLMFAVIILCLPLAGFLIVAGILAYHTDTDIMVNVFTVGDIKIAALEPDFPTADDPKNGRVDGVPDECELMVPYESMPKNPCIKNIGTNECIVFFRVTNPVETLNLINDDGTRVKDTLEDLFWFKLADDEEDSHKNHFNPQWVELTSVDGEIVECEGVNDEGLGKTYIFGYHVVLQPGETTSTLFDKVQNKKYGSRTIGPDEIEQIKVESFAIQATEIKKAGVDVNTPEGTIETSGELDEETLTRIYKIFVNQNEDTVGKGAWNNESADGNISGGDTGSGNVNGGN